MLIRPYKNASIGQVTSRFNASEDYRGGAIHTGTDFAPPNAYGTPLVAVEDCVINKIVTPTEINADYADLKRGYGVEMVAKEWIYLFWHCLPFFGVSVGDVVKQGKIVGFIGNSGLVYRNGVFVPLEIRTEKPYLGSHLHFEKYRWENGQKKYYDVLPDIEWALPVGYDTLDWITSIRVAVLKIKALLG